MPGWHENHQAVYLATFNRLKGVGDPLMMRSGRVKRVGVLSERYQAFARRSPP